MDGTQGGRYDKGVVNPCVEILNDNGVIGTVLFAELAGDASRLAGFDRNRPLVFGTARHLMRCLIRNQLNQMFRTVSSSRAILHN